MLRPNRLAFRLPCASVLVILGTVALMLFVSGIGTRAWGQVFDLSGGSSTLYQSQGATLKFHSATLEGGVSGGAADGHVLAGFYVRHTAPTVTYTLGVQSFKLNLPTDLFSGEHYLDVIGAGVQLTRHQTRVEAFAGATSTRVDSPYVQGFHSQTPSVAVLLEHSFSPTVRVSTQFLAASAVTLLQSGEWKPLPWVKVGGTAGFEGTAHYAAASVDLKRPIFDLQAEYIGADSKFQRAGTQVDQAPEFVRENILFTIRSSETPSLTVTAARQNFLMPKTADPSSVDSSTSPSIGSLNQISATQRVGPVHMTASLFHSASGGNSNLAYVLSTTVPVTRRLEVQSNFYNNRLLNSDEKPKSSLVTTLRQRLSSRMSVSETINRSGGATTVGFGGAVQSSTSSVSVDYQTIYVATRPQNPFQQTLMLDLQISVMGRILFHAGTLVSPTGKLLYTADARALQGLSRTPTIATEHSRLGNSVLYGRVVDPEGNGIVGAAIEIDGRLNFTDSDGKFFLREKKPTLHMYRVALNEFLDGLAYRIVSKPMELGSSRSIRPPAVIVVQRTGE